MRLHLLAAVLLGFAGATPGMPAVPSRPPPVPAALSTTLATRPLPLLDPATCAVPGTRSAAAEVAGPAPVDHGAMDAAPAPAAAAPSTHGPNMAPGAEVTWPAPDHAVHGVPGAVSCQPTAEEATAADDLVARTAAALRRRFPNALSAMAAGYKQSESPLDRTVHYWSKAEREDPTVLDPEQPEVIIYSRFEGRTEVAGAIFSMPDLATPGPRFGGCLTTWHRHELSGRPTPDMIHVWIVPNRNGAFAEGLDRT